MGDDKRITLVGGGALNRLDVLRGQARPGDIDVVAETFEVPEQEPPPMPARVARLPRCPRRHIPVPWFVAWDQASQAVPDFRVADPDKMDRAHRSGLCWVCGEPRGHRAAFVIGPMCSVNRISSEPPSHEECATYSALVCPFLTKPNMRRRPDLLERVDAGELSRGAGEGHLRNPGVCLVWLTHSYAEVGDGRGGRLFRVGKPVETRWYTRGRLATREEATEALVAGVREVTLPAAVREGPRAVAYLQQLLDAAWPLLPGGHGAVAAPRLLVHSQAYEAARAGSAVQVGTVPASEV